MADRDSISMIDRNTTSTPNQTWGKLRFGPDRQTVESWLPLESHCIDVAMVFRQLLELPLQRKRMEALAGSRLTDAQLDRLAVIAFLHDFGKCNRGFQAKADPAARDTAGHVLEAAALLFELHELWPPSWTQLIMAIQEWFACDEQAAQMLLASLSHHGRPVSEKDYEHSGVSRTVKRLWTEAHGYDPLEALAQLAQTACQRFPKAFETDLPPIDATPSLQHRFAGLVMLADWIASDTQFFPFETDTEDRKSFARKTAEHALKAIGLIAPEERKPRPFAAVFPFPATPLQKALAEDLDVGEDARLLLVESDTGSGKTEAALAWFFRLYAQGLVDGLYFALPTRVAAREIYTRVLKAMEAAFEPAMHPGPILLAAPGYVQVDGEKVPMLADPNGKLWDDNAQDAWRERLWSAERPKRFLAAPIAVGTIDQALLSVLQVKHSLLRSVCLDRHLLVVDEVHASDPYMREVLRTLLEGHRQRGGWALLLSATLGESAAASYFARKAMPFAEASQKPYPLISSHSQSWAMPSARERCIQVEPSPTLTDDEAILPLLIEALERKARVLVVCNTVARANALFRRVEDALQERHPHLASALFGANGVHCPHHGRFAREDRELLDAAVTAQLGKASADGARLLIGTQTLEQSLDIDADWLVTDLAPMDVLIQRLGRLHRHARARRPQGFAAPKALVRIPKQDLMEYLDEKGNLRAPAGLGSDYVYADGRVLACTVNMLKTHPELHLPAQARKLIEGATHLDALDALPESWRHHGDQLEGKIQAEIVQALRSVLNDKPFGELHYPDKSERVLTRLGRPTYEIPFEKPAISPFGAPLQRIAIPSHWLEGKVPESIHPEPFDHGFRFNIGNKAFRYTRLGLEKDDA